MKALGRILVIVAAFALMMCVIYLTVNTGGSSTNAPAFQRGGDGFTPNDARPEFRGEDGGNSFGMLFGMLKNTIIVAAIVALIVFPKNLLQQKRRVVPVRIE
jgi:hypothetical protein